MYFRADLFSGLGEGRGAHCRIKRESLIRILRYIPVTDSSIILFLSKQCSEVWFYIFMFLGVSVTNKEIDMNKGDNHNVASGCESQMPTHCVSNPCPAYSTCKDEFDSYKCVCTSGYVGKHCVDVCSLKPCRHGQCIRNVSKKGFKCVCPSQYTGNPVTAVFF